METMAWERIRTLAWLWRWYPSDVQTSELIVLGITTDDLRRVFEEIRNENRRA